ncbi:alanine racemase [Candidatus Daviesbacteria bacterium]|nr:alanine racemase [Candidatus Daviesbacteria bacterium]
MLNSIKNLLGINIYQPLNLIEVSKENLIKNYQYLSSLSSGIRIAPVLKSNAYGHGLVNVGKVLDNLEVPFFCVDSIYEAYELLKSKVKTPILITGYVNPNNLKVKQLPFSFAVWNLELVESISKHQPNASIHLFIDTGMHREGITLDDLPEFLVQIKEYKNLKLDGIMSHFASVKNTHDPLYINQLENFKKALEICKKDALSFKWIHIAASDGLQNGDLKTLSKITNVARVGLALYGVSEKKENLNPALTFKTKIVQIKKLKKGESVGYDGTFIASHDMLIGILPAGYNDGIDRRLSNKGFVKIEDKYCKIIGRVSMNLCTIDLSPVKNPQIGSEVIIYSDNPEDKNSILKLASSIYTIPYELLIHLTSTTKRIAA